MHYGSDIPYFLCRNNELQSENAIIPRLGVFSPGLSSGFGADGEEASEYDTAMFRTTSNVYRPRAETVLDWQRVVARRQGPVQFEKAADLQTATSTSKRAENGGGSGSGREDEDPFGIHLGSFFYEATHQEDQPPAVEADPSAGHWATTKKQRWN